MFAHMTCGTCIVLVVAGITYGLYLAIMDLFPHAAHVVPPKHYNDTDDSHHRAETITEFLTSENATKEEDLLTLLFNRSLSVSAFPLPKKDVPPQCIDPTFACQDLESAKICGVAKSCIHDIWATMGAPQDNDQICDICKEMVKEARDQLLSNMTQEEIKEVFEGSCKLLPIKLVADACIKVVDEIIPELVEMLASRMDPNMVCTVSGLCNAVTDNQVSRLVKMILASGNADECQECTTMVTDVKTFLKSTPESEVEKYIENFCDKEMPSYLCDVFVDSYLPSIYKYVMNTDAKKLCSSAGVCPKICNPSEVSQVNDELTCEFCEHVLQHIKDLVTANSTAEEFRTALLNFCKHTGSFSDKCTALVNDYYDMLFDYIRKLDTKGMCTLIGLCNNEKCAQIPMVKLVPAVQAHKRIPMIKLQPAVPSNIDTHPLVRLIPAIVANKKNMIETNDIFPSQLPLEKYIHPLAIFQKDTECAFCKAISFYLEKDLNGDRSQDGVRKALDNVCERWVKDFPDQCKDFMNKYSVKVENAIVDGMKFDEVCIYSKACAAENKHSELHVKVMSKAGDGPFCDLCKDTMNEIENTLSDPATKQKLEDFVDQGCNILPQSIRDDCVSFLNSNVDALIDILEQELKPDNFCPAVRLCDEESRVGVPQRVKDLECDVCKDVVSSLRQKLSDPSSKEIVLIFFEEGCARLPGSLAQECKTFIDQNIDTVMGMLIQELDPDTVCSVLRICPGKVEKLKDVECDLCKEVVSKVEDLVKDKKTEDEIKSALDKVCSYLPSSLSAKCENFVNEYTDILIQLLLQEMDPDMVCAELKICTSSVKKEKPKKFNDLECDLCKEVVGKVEKLVKDKKTEEEIKSALEKVCSYLPSTYADKCKTFVDQYTETLITLLMEEMDPDMICASLNICPTNAQYSAWQSKAKDLECQGCQYALHFLQEQLSSPETQGEVKNLLKKFCDVLPQTYAKNCDAFVDEYGSSLLVLLAQEIDPSILCYELKMCTNQTRMFQKPVVNILHPFKTDECSVCTTVVDYIDKLLEEDDVDKELTQLVEKVCTILPASYVDKCSTMLETYGPYILQMIGQVADSKEVCQEIDMCSRPPGHVHLLGGNKCTFGPSYWCKSNAHASACKAEMFCKEKVWKN
nr:venom protein [Lampona murina]